MLNYPLFQPPFIVESFFTMDTTYHAVAPCFSRTDYVSFYACVMVFNIEGYHGR